MTTANLGWTERGPSGQFLGGVPRSKVDVSERFWPKVEIKGEQDCWDWQASINSTGYGSFQLDGKSVGAHRVAYSLALGRVPAGMHVLHHCDNRRCCNPKHFFIGTNDDNHRDKMEKGRQAKGETAGTVSFTELDVRYLRDKARSGESIAYLVRRTGFPHCTVYNAVYGLSWAHVEGALVAPKMANDLDGQTKAITARDLRDATSTYVAMVGRGMEITITKDGAAVAVLSRPKSE